MSPVTGKRPNRESNRTASNEISLRSKSTTPMASMRSTTTGVLAAGQVGAHLGRARPAATGSSNSRMIASSTETSTGTPQVMRAVGPATHWSSWTGNSVSSAADEARRVADRVVGEQDVVEDALLEAGAEGVDGDRALVAEDAADAGEAEAEAEVDRQEVGRDHHQQRVALASARELRGEQADGLQRDALEVELDDAGVLLLGRIVVQVAAAGDDRGVDDEADAARRLEPDVRRRAALGVDDQLEADPFDAGGDRAEPDARRPATPRSAIPPAVVFEPAASSR